MNENKPVKLKLPILKRAREWDVLKCSNNGDCFIRGEDTKDNEFVKVREVMPTEKTPEQIREDAIRRFVKYLRDDLGNTENSEHFCERIEKEFLK